MQTCKPRQRNTAGSNARTSASHASFLEFWVLRLVWCAPSVAEWHCSLYARVLRFLRADWSDVPLRCRIKWPMNLSGMEGIRDFWCCFRMLGKGMIKAKGDMNMALLDVSMVSDLYRKCTQ
jgi:hypothetical protein